MINKEFLKELLVEKEELYEKYEEALALNERESIGQYEEDDMTELHKIEGTIDVLKLLIKKMELENVTTK